MWALVKDNVVANTIELSDPAGFMPPAGYTLLEFAECGIGWAVVDGVAVRPPDPDPVIVVPPTITMRQCRLQLLADDVLDDVDAAVSTMGAAAKIEWEYAIEIQRSNPLVPAMQSILAWDTARVDQFYQEASKL